MNFRGLRYNLLRKLCKGLDLSIFKKSSNPARVSNFKEKLILGTTFRKIYSLEVANLEHLLNRLPFIDGSKCLGNIDFIRECEKDSYVVRGWLFSPEFPIEGLSLLIGDSRYPIYAHRLNRVDVSEVLGFLENAQFSGFVCLIENVHLEKLQKEIAFEARTSSGAVHRGSFEKVTMNSQ